jgi:acyl-coenzyme A thioesterase PaaI-like protein
MVESTASPNNCRSPSATTTPSVISNHKKSWPNDLPSWAEGNARQAWGERLTIDEWEGNDQQTVDSYRRDHGWKGSDLVHSISSPVRILEYRIRYPIVIPHGPGRGAGEGTMLTGMVHFTPKAESHQGFCHGGSMTSIMDDAIGWIGFCVTGECRPWTGFTVQVNTSLKKPVEVDTILMIRVVIDKVERRKVFAKVMLVDPSVEKEVVYAMGDGLVIINRGVITGH